MQVQLGLASRGDEGQPGSPRLSSRSRRGRDRRSDRSYSRDDDDYSPSASCSLSPAQSMAPAQPEPQPRAPLRRRLGLVQYVQRRLLYRSRRHRSRRRQRSRGRREGRTRSRRGRRRSATDQGERMLPPGARAGARIATASEGRCLWDYECVRNSPRILKGGVEIWASPPRCGQELNIN